MPGVPPIPGTLVGAQGPSLECHEQTFSRNDRVRHRFAHEASRLSSRGDHGSAVQKLATTNMENVSQDHLGHEHL